MVILYDNDSGRKPIHEEIRRASHSTPDYSTPFLHVIKNLYAVPTPLVKGEKESSIEDFFDADTRALVLGGKTFNSKGPFDKEKHYGKKIFAHQVVRRRAESIDFGGFLLF